MADEKELEQSEAASAADEPAPEAEASEEPTAESTETQAAEGEATDAPAPEAEAPEEPAAEEAPAAEAEAPTTEEAPAAEAEAEAEAPAEAAAEAPAEAEEHTYESLSHKTVAELRDIAQGLHADSLKGYSTMHKEQLVPALCEALGIEAHVHHEVVGIDKSKVKTRIRALKEERDRAVEAGDSRQLRVTRRRIRSLKRKIRKATV